MVPRGVNRIGMLERFKEVSGGKSIGAIRASFGYANNSTDVERALKFFAEQADA
jgi:selenocysteine lyase/cysteine desulfurase